MTVVRVGDTVRVVTRSQLFASEFDGQTGVVTVINSTRVVVRFECGSVDYGLPSDVVLVSQAETETTTVKEKLDLIEQLVVEIKTILGN